MDWSNKLAELGVKVKELTGDTNEFISESSLRDADLVISTPEKWDSVTRSLSRNGRKGHGLTSEIGLIMIDEVHHLSDSSRGHTLEAVVSRAKLNGDSGRKTRFVAASATVPNLEDVAVWLGGQEAVYKTFGEEMRPVRLRRIVFGYHKATSDFRFEMGLSYKIGPLIATYSNGKPTLIFANSRKGTQTTAAQVTSRHFNYLPN